MRILGLDYGTKRVGVALTDPLRIIVQPREYLNNDATFFDHLLKIVKEFSVTEIVIGYPRSLNGTPGPMAKEVESFKKKMDLYVNIPIHFWDEQFTTSQAEKFLIQANVRREKRKQVKDSIAAVLMLQGYLESKSQR